MAIYKGNIKLDANGTLTSSVPTGSILQYDGNTIPSGYEEANGFDNYSTTEHKVGTWIDGKPIYSKTFQLTTVANPTSTQNLITFSDVDNILKIEGYVIASSSTYFVPYYFNNTAYVQPYRNSSTSVKILCGSSYGFGDTTITIFYTKTTDSAS